MVYIHGGGYVHGGSADPLYNGRNLSKNGVVVVTINYRLNIFSFLNPTLPMWTDGADYSGNTGNLAVADQIQALKWVKENISAFGGDPNNVTIFGESAGSVYVSVLALTKKAVADDGSPLFKRVIAEMNKITLDKLRDFVQEFSAVISYVPYADGEYIPVDPVAQWGNENARKYDILQGTNQDEMRYYASFLSWDLYFGMVGELKGYLAADPKKSQGYDAVAAKYDEYINNNYEEKWRTTEWANDYLFGTHGYQAQTHTNSYMYYFNYVSSSLKREGYDCCHAAELPYVFGYYDGFYADGNADDLKMTQIIQSIWTGFAKTGVPQLPGGETWPKYSEQTRTVAQLNLTPVIRKDFRKERVELFNQMLLSNDRIFHCEYIQPLLKLYLEKASDK